MAAQTGSTYISGSMIDSVEIPKAKWGFSTMTSSNQNCLKLSATTTDNRKCEYGHPGPEILVSVENNQVNNNNNQVFFCTSHPAIIWHILCIYFLFNPLIFYYCIVTFYGIMPFFSFKTLVKMVTCGF